MSLPSFDGETETDHVIRLTSLDNRSLFAPADAYRCERCGLTTRSREAIAEVDCNRYRDMAIDAAGGTDGVA